MKSKMEAKIMMVIQTDEYILSSVNCLEDVSLNGMQV